MSIPLFTLYVTGDITISMQGANITLLISSLTNCEFDGGTQECVSLFYWYPRHFFNGFHVEAQPSQSWELEPWWFPLDSMNSLMVLLQRGWGSVGAGAKRWTSFLQIKNNQSVACLLCVWKKNIPAGLAAQWGIIGKFQQLRMSMGRPGLSTCVWGLGQNKNAFFLWFKINNQRFIVKRCRSRSPLMVPRTPPVERRYRPSRAANEPS